MPSKGSKYEREICRTLSLWLSHGKHDDWLWRSAGSGSRATTRRAKGKRTKGHAGDIAPTCGEAEILTDLLTIEIKRGYPRTSLHDLIDRPDSGARNTYEAWIQQAIDANEAAGTYSWLLITKRDRREPIVMFSTHLIASFFEGLSPFDFPTAKIDFVDNNNRIQTVTITRLENFLQATKPALLKGIWEWWKSRSERSGTASRTRRKSKNRKS